MFFFGSSVLSTVVGFGKVRVRGRGGSCRILENLFFFVSYALNIKEHIKCLFKCVLLIHPIVLKSNPGRDALRVYNERRLKIRLN